MTPGARRVLDKILIDNGCWMWGASISGGGYGQVAVAGKLQRAHRAVYRLLVGPIPDGMELDHLCRVPACVKPDHLEPVTPAENIARARNAHTTCHRGHPRTDANTYTHSSGRRNCRPCGRENAAMHDLVAPWART